MSTFNDNNYFHVITLPDTIILFFLLIEKWTVMSLRYKKITWNKIRSAHIILPRFYYCPLSFLLELRWSEIPPLLIINVCKRQKIQVDCLSTIGLKSDLGSDFELKIQICDSLTSMKLLIYWWTFRFVSFLFFGVFLSLQLHM